MDRTKAKYEGKDSRPTETAETTSGGAARGDMVLVPVSQLALMGVGLVQMSAWIEVLQSGKLGSDFRVLLESELGPAIRASLQSVHDGRAAFEKTLTLLKAGGPGGVRS